MKCLTIALLFLPMLGCSSYTTQKVEDVKGNPAFIRINTNTGAVCILSAHNMVLADFKRFDFDSNYRAPVPPALPFCEK